MVLTFSDDVAENIRFADEASAALRLKVDDYIARAGIAAPAATDDPAEVVAARLPSPPLTALDLAARGIGIGTTSGLYFPGLDFASTRKSGTILAAADETRRIVSHILARLGA